MTRAAAVHDAEIDLEHFAYTAFLLRGGGWSIGDPDSDKRVPPFCAAGEGIVIDVRAGRAAIRASARRSTRHV